MSVATNKQLDYLEGFFPAGPFTDEHQLTQLRMLAKRLRLASLPQITGMLAGGHDSKQKGRGLDLDQLRQYLPGDDIRSIDWRVTARTQTPHTRVYKEERERPVMIVCDQRTPMFFGSKRSFKSVVAAQCAAIIAWAALDHGDRVGALVLGDQTEKDFRPKQRSQHVLQILQTINQYNHALEKHQNITNTLSNCLNKLHQGVKPGTTIYIISDFFDLSANDKAALFNLKRHNHVVALQVFDALERQMPPPGLYAVTDGLQEGFLDTQNKHSQQAYKEAVNVFQQGIEQTFKQLAINHHQIDASDIPFMALKIALEQRGKV
ncbi:DUF58 domain-containing protein [Oceaniserpentilla sp. 4NH20-0058]|uniref:DUF58 domain-containing protein n=1 Tax=Oceaniserpentilla sp. 4NH20-0058 TaxID=3127660 RepID=UPI003109C6C4